jgi:excisionase family DNA binding protein
MTTSNGTAVDGASDGLLDKPELAAKLRISKRTVDAWMKKRRLPFIKIGKTVRFNWSEVLERLGQYRVN